MYKDTLKVSGMIFHAYHGLEPHEMENGQRFEVDVAMKFDSSRAATSDRLKDTIDVREIYNHVHQVIVKGRFYLIETISQKIAENILENFDIDEITVRVRKPFAPLGGLANGTEIEITRQREK